MNKVNSNNGSKNIKWHPSSVNREMLEGLRGHKGMVLWFTGLSGSGKSTLAEALAKTYNCYLVKEFARDFLNQLDRSYKYDDLLNIAKNQYANEKKMEKKIKKSNKRIWYLFKNIFLKNLIISISIFLLPDFCC